MAKIDWTELNEWLEDFYIFPAGFHSIDCRHCVKYPPKEQLKQIIRKIIRKVTKK